MKVSLTTGWTGPWAECSFWYIAGVARWTKEPRKFGWVGGIARSHAELEAIDRRFWEKAGPSERVAVSLILAVETWRLAHPGAVTPRLDRSVFGVRRRRSLRGTKK
jgi:hypothetical protein